MKESRTRSCGLKRRKKNFRGHGCFSFPSTYPQNRTPKGPLPSFELPISSLSPFSPSSLPLLLNRPCKFRCSYGVGIPCVPHFQIFLSYSDNFVEFGFFLKLGGSKVKHGHLSLYADMTELGNCDGFNWFLIIIVLSV